MATHPLHILSPSSFSKTTLAVPISRSYLTSSHKSVLLLLCCILSIVFISKFTCHSCTYSILCMCSCQCGCVFIFCVTVSLPVLFCVCICLYVYTSAVVFAGLRTWSYVRINNCVYVCCSVCAFACLSVQQLDICSSSRTCLYDYMIR